MSDQCVKSFSTSYARAEGPARFVALLVVLAVVIVGVAPPAAAKKARDPEDLFNPLLGIQYSHWLIGPIVEIATDDEVEAYLALTSDDAAAHFIEAFWQKRNAGTAVFTKTPQQIFEARAGEADKRYSEGTYPGWKTDRGTIYVLYGEPEEITFDSPPEAGESALEVWKYPKDATDGLDGKKPKRLYRFYRDGEHTVFYTGQKNRDPRRQLRPSSSGFGA